MADWCLTATNATGTRSYYNAGPDLATARELVVTLAEAELARDALARARPTPEHYRRWPDARGIAVALAGRVVLHLTITEGRP